MLENKARKRKKGAAKHMSSRHACTMPLICDRIWTCVYVCFQRVSISHRIEIHTYTYKYARWLRDLDSIKAYVHEPLRPTARNRASSETAFKMDDCDGRRDKVTSSWGPHVQLQWAPNQFGGCDGHTPNWPAFTAITTTRQTDKNKQISHNHITKKQQQQPHYHQKQHQQPHL